MTRTLLTLLILHLLITLKSQSIIGLSDNYNSFIYLDSDSLLWISSLNALNRFNGSKVKIYWPDKFNNNALSEGLIQSKFYEDSVKNIWFTTVNYLNKYDKRTDSFSRFSLGDSSSMYRILDVVEGGIIYLQINDGIYKFNTQTKIFSLIFEKFQGIDFEVLYSDKFEIQKIVATRWNYGNGVLVLYKNANNSYECDTILRDHVSWNIEQYGGDFLVSTNKGLFKVNHLNQYKRVSEKSTFSLEKDSDGYIIINQQDSVYTYDGTLNIKPIFSSKKYSKIFEPSKNLLLGTIENEGLFYIQDNSDSNWNFISTSSPVFKVIYQNKNVFLSLKYGDILKLIENDLEQIINLDYEPIFVQGDHNHLEVISDTKRIRVHESGQTVQFENYGLDRVRGGTILKDDRIAYYSGKGISIYDQSGFKRLNSNHTELDITFLDRKGYVYNHAKEGLVIHKVNGDILEKVLEMDVNFSIHQFYERNDSTILIATNEGIKELIHNKNELSSFAFENLYIQSIIEDKNNSLWVGTRNGLYKMDSNKKVSYYSENNGLHSHTFSHDCATSTPDGTLYFGTNKGILYFHPDSIKDIDYNPPMMLTSLKIHDHEWADDTLNIEVRDRIDKLDFNQNTLTFDFVAVDYDPQSHPQYSVFLEGYDVDTTFLGDQSKMTYPNLQPGNYRFHYSACTLSGYCRDKFETFEFTINPPYWETWWFRTLGVLAVLGVIGFGIGLYLRNRLREQRFEFEKQQLVLKTELQLQQERNRIADELHDELGGKLSSIKFAGKKVQKATHIDDVKKITQRVSEISTELIESMRSIIWAMDTQNDTFSSLQANIRSYASTLGRDNDLKMHFNFQENKEEVIVKGQIRHHLFLTIKELLNNIIKHSSASEVELEMTTIDNSLKTIITENGQGFTLNEISNYGKGIKSIDKRMKTIDSAIAYNKADKMIITIITPLS